MVMRKAVLVSSVSLFVILLSACGPEDSVDVRFPNGRTVKCEIADTIKEIREGLQFHDSLAAERGMLFIYAQENTRVGFYMPKRMKFNLDMIFLDKERKVLLIEKDLPPCEHQNSADCPTYGPAGKPCKYVVEVVAGLSDEVGLEIGDQLEFKLP